MSQMADERRLLASLAAGDRQAAERLVEQSYRSIYAALVRLCGDEELAADLTQETYRKAWAALPGFRGGAQLSTWLYRIAYNTFLKHLRRPRLLNPLDEEQGNRLRDPDPAPDEACSRSEEASRLRRAVLRLPDPLRFTVAARYWGELPVAEIARLEQVTTVAVRKRLTRAFNALRLALEQEVS